MSADADFPTRADRSVRAVRAASSDALSPDAAINLAAIEAEFIAAAHADDTPEMREARALAALFPRCFLAPTSRDTFAGRVHETKFGFDPRRGGVFFSDAPSSRDAVFAACSPQMRSLLTSSSPLRANDGWNGFVLDYDTLLTQGLPGLRVRVDARRGIARAPRAAWDGMLAALDVVQHSAETLAEQAAAAGLARCADALAAIAVHPPRTLFEALQLLLLYSAHIGFPEQHGRMDVYLGDLYADDLRAGRITPEDAERLLAEFFHMCAEGRGAPGRVTVGGRGRRNAQHADAFALLVAAIAERQAGYGVELDVRMHGEESTGIAQRMRALAAAGRAVLHDDDALLPRIAHEFDVTFNIAEHYVPIGAETYGLGHAGFHAPLCTLDLAAPANEHDVQALIEAAADFHALACDMAAVEAPCLLHSLLLDGCIARGETVFTGGVRLLGGAILVRGAAPHARETLRERARDQRARTWLQAYVCGWE